MTLLLKYIKKIKIVWLATILTLIVQLNDLVCMLGFFIMPFVKYPESMKMALFFCWIYTAIIVFIFMFVSYREDLKNNQKEIAEYKKDKVLYFANRIGVFVYFVGLFVVIFLVRNALLKLSLIYVIGIAVLGLLILAMIIALLTQYKDNYKKMAKDTITFLFVFFVVIFCSITILSGIMIYENTSIPNIYSQLLIGIGAIPLLLGGIYLVCKMFLSNKMLHEKSDGFPISIVLFIAIGIVISIVLRYAINDSKMQEIMTTVFSAILGGAITLAGVAWTIKKGDEDKKETHKLTLKPWLFFLRHRIAPEDRMNHPRYVFTMSGLSEKNEKNFCVLKNTDNGIAILKKITTTNYEYFPVGDAVVDKNCIFNLYICFDDDDTRENLRLIVEDVLHNEYIYKFIVDEYPKQISGIIEVSENE